MMVCVMKSKGSVWELRENSDCGAMGTIYREIVLSGAVGVFFGECDKATGSCFGLLCSGSQPG